MTTREKVLVVHVITQLELGGAQEITLVTCRRLDRSRFEARLIAGPGGLLDDDAAAMPNGTFEHEPNLVREVRPATDLRCFVSLASRFRRARGSWKGRMIVHTHSSKAGILGRFAAAAAGVDVRVHSIHGFGFHPEQSLVAMRAFQGAERLAARVTHGFSADSADNLRVAAELGLLRGGKPAIVLPPGIDVEAYHPVGGERESIRAELGIRLDSPLVGMIACFKPQKAPVDFVHVAERVRRTHPGAHFFFAGDGVLRPDVERAIRDLQLEDRVHLLGWRRDVPKLLAAADVMVLTSLWEGLPRAILQAMAAGKPMVANAVDGVPEAIVDGETGYLARTHDVETFALRVSELLDQPLLRSRMGKAAARRAAEFGATSIVRRLEALYEELLARP